MPGGLSRDVLRNLTTLCTAGVVGNLSDEQLLDRFIELSDEVAEAAFATLVQRHGAMVLGVCHRILRDVHAAEDAFQATFLVLARKATSVVPRDRVANWLYGVAYRTANESRVRTSRRRAREAKVARRPRDQSPGETSPHELREILDDELAALPSRYRGPLVLCELEGLSRQDAARRLAIREGTLSSRLARGKARLRERLARRGFEPPAGAVPFVLIREATTTLLTDRLIDSTTQAAMRVAAGVSTAAVVSTSVVSLTEGVLKGMLLSKLKGIALVIGSSLAVVSGAVALGQSGPGPQSTGPAEFDRMTIMERKLDRIIDALDRMTGSMPGSSNVAKYANQPGAIYPSYGKGSSSGKGSTVTVPWAGPNDLAHGLPGGPATQPAKGVAPPGLAERVAAVEQDLRTVQQLLEQLAGRVNELEWSQPGAGRPALGPLPGTQPLLRKP
jgi:RNA polymerase sigma factor (sigma-70 family)